MSGGYKYSLGSVIEGNTSNNRANYRQESLIEPSYSKQKTLGEQLAEPAVYGVAAKNLLRKVLGRNPRLGRK